MRAAGVVLAAWLAVAAFADVLASDRQALVPYGPATVDKSAAPLAAPDARHWLGTDASSRDVLARLIHGTRVTLVVGLATALLTVAIGLFLGALAGYSGQIADTLLARLSDAMLALPLFFVALAILGVVRHAGIGMVILTLALCAWPPIARLARAETKSLRDAEFVIAARAFGASPWYVIRHHVLPHLMPLAFVAVVFAFATAVMVEASLSFLGFGVPDTVATWGGLMRGAMQKPTAWWLVLAPGAALTSVVLAGNALGERLTARRRSAQWLSEQAGA